MSAMNREPQQPVPTRRRYQFSLRAVFAMTIVVSLLLGGFVYVRNQARRQAEAVATIERHGFVEYDFAFRRNAEGRYTRVPRAESGIPQWMLKRVGRDFFHEVVQVYVDLESGDSTSASELWNAVGQLEDIEELHVELGRQDEFDLNHISGLGRLRHLSVTNGSFCRGSVSVLEQLPSLEELTLSETVASDPLLSSLSRIPHLSRITFARIDLDDGDLACLENCLKLREITIDGTLVTSRDIQHLSRVPNLQSLSLFRTLIADGQLAEIGSLANLHSLGITDSPITDEGILELRRLRGLNYLNLSGTRVTAQQLPLLAGLQSIDLSGTGLTDEGLARLAKLPAIREVVISGTKPTAEGVHQLRRTKPNVVVIGP